ncbi:MAG TPA: bifunctional adenosylcobinamide kinase/adenosylcobinamide-phosphate guanylyltransferase, partial [Streptosporangiaceae bacterium]|nr:bifunctional adenosylcobinamide kinase/adenosylcobinamide-phosphate guanylyltransferase [Streptosporangiaceae bacterium]
RSGKSAEAELRVAAEPEVTYVATGPVASAGSGDEWAARVAAHRARRPSWWRTVESTDLPAVIGQARGAVLVDSVTTWLAATMDECGAWTGSAAATAALAGRTGELVTAWRQAGCYLVAVTDETGLGIVPGTRAGRMFRDELGRLNQILAAESDEVTVVVAGRAQPLPD